MRKKYEGGMFVVATKDSLENMENELINKLKEERCNIDLFMAESMHEKSFERLIFKVGKMCRNEPRWIGFDIKIGGKYNFNIKKEIYEKYSIKRIYKKTEKEKITEKIKEKIYLVEMFKKEYLKNRSEIKNDKLFNFILDMSLRYRHIDLLASGIIEKYIEELNNKNNREKMFDAIIYASNNRLRSFLELCLMVEDESYDIKSNCKNSDILEIEEYSLDERISSAILSPWKLGTEDFGKEENFRKIKIIKGMCAIIILGKGKDDIEYLEFCEDKLKKAIFCKEKDAEKLKTIFDKKI